VNQFPITSVFTVVLALITTIVLTVWAKLDKKSRPYSWLAAIWTGIVLLVFAVLWCMSTDGYQEYDIRFMANAVPGVFIGSLVVMLVISTNEIRLHLNGASHGKHS